jgi:two-component system response regulator AtoC
MQSGRNPKAWVKISCPAIPHTLIESELFGFEKGAFTGAHMAKRGRIELAHQGTLFLDEVGSLDMATQSKLLQVLQDGTYMRVGGHESRHVDARLVCAANANLREQTAEGNFRMDFLYRINAITLEVPPLRERTDDIPALVDYFLDVHAREFGVEPKPLSRDVKVLMCRYGWPGNIRELENVVRSYVLMGNEDTIISEMVPSIEELQDVEINLDSPVSLKEITRSTRLKMERAIILKVLRANGWSRQHTAKWLRISYRSLLYKLQELQITGASAGKGDIPAEEPEQMEEKYAN